MRTLSHRTISGLLCLGLPAAVLAACSGSYPGSEEDYGSVQEALTETMTFREGANGYTGATDATIRQAAATTNYGAAVTCEADGDDGSGVDKSCLLRWSLAGVPADAVITSASITLRVVNSTANTYSLYELLRPWDEAAVTWSRASSSVNWTSAGALSSSDRGAVVGSITGSTGSKTITLNSAGVAMVQRWLTGTGNNGLIIANASNADGVDIASSEASTVANRPLLSITYTTAGGTSGTGGSAGTGGTGGSAGSAGSGSTGSGQEFLMAFIGDQGNGSNADAVLNLIKNEGAEATMHNGDFDYANNPTAFDNRVTNILGANYPYFAVIGNHDAAAWGGSNGYSSKLAARVARVPSMQCTGEIGVKANCSYRGVQLIESCVGVSELRSTCGKDAADQIGFIQSALASSSAPFKFCNWHKNQNDMQTGSKGDEVGWQAYQACMNAGAIVATGHEHSYERTRILTNIGNTGAGHGVTGSFNVMDVSAGASFVFVSGLGGVEIRDFEGAGHNDDTWWATTYASNRWYKNGALQPATTASYGALFIRFNVGGNPKLANAYFKDTTGRIVDQYTIQVP